MGDTRPLRSDSENSPADSLPGYSSPQSSSPSLETIANDFRTFPGLLRKKPIREVYEILGKQEFASQGGAASWTGGIPGGYRPVADLGEDAAVFLSGNRKSALLLAADGIMEELVETDPFWAGYCSIMVNVHDIAACGGSPLAAVNVVSARDEGTLKRLVEGLREGCEKFGVFMAGGHTHPHARHDSISVAILGSAPSDRLIYSHTAGSGDVIIFALELEGERRTRFGWNSTSGMTPEEVMVRLELPGNLAAKGLITAGKDISNPGCLGTAAMLLESSGLGARISVDEIPHPPEDAVPFREWLHLYHGCGFVLTAREEDAADICRGFERIGMAAAACGTLDLSRELVIERDGESVPVIDLEKNPVTGIGNHPENVK